MREWLGCNKKNFGFGLASLEGPARNVPLSVNGRPEYETLVSVLQARFWTKNLSNLNYFLFQSCKQQKGQSISDLTMKAERLAHAAFSDCSIKTRDRLAASQFISSLANEEMKRMLKLGGFTNLRAALVRAFYIEAVDSIS